MYFSTSATYIFPYFGVKPNPVIIVAFLIPGNVYPVSEDHTGDQSLIGAPVKRGYQCHYAVTNDKGGISQVASDCDEVVVFQEAQVHLEFLPSLSQTPNHYLMTLLLLYGIRPPFLELPLVPTWSCGLTRLISARSAFFVIGDFCTFSLISKGLPSIHHHS